MKKFLKILISILVIAIIATLVVLSVFFVKQYNSFKDEKKGLKNEIVVIKNDLSAVNDKINSTNKEKISLEEKNLLLESKKREVENKIANNSWQILQVGEAATRKIEDINDEWRNAELNYNYGNISIDDCIDILHKAQINLNTYKSILSRATSLGEKYSSYVTSSIEDSSFAIPSGDLNKQLDSLDKDNGNLISQLSKLDNNIKTNQEKLNKVTKKNASKLYELSNKETILKNKIELKEKRIKEIEESLNSFPYSWISIIKK